LKLLKQHKKKPHETLPNSINFGIFHIASLLKIVRPCTLQKV